MEYVLTKDTIIKKNNEGIIIYNTRTTDNVELSGIAIEIFNILLNEGDLKAISKLLEIPSLDELTSRVTLNSLIYPLIHLKLISPRNTKIIDGKKINITTTAIETTNKCNFRCPHCYVDKADFKVLTYNEIKDLIDELYNLGGSNILFTGGEVLTHRHFKDFYIYAYKKGFMIAINTNGSLLDDSLIEFLKKTPPLSLEISLYGHNQKTFENFTKTKISFDMLIETFKKIKEANISLLCKSVITNGNKEYYKDMENICKDLDIPFKKDYITFPSLDKSHDFNPEQISPSEVIEFLKDDKIAQREYLKIFSNNDNEAERKYVFECRRDNDGLFISSEGKVNICPCMQSVSYQYQKGNLLECVLKLQELKNMEFRKDSKCKNCKYISLCRYCPAKFHLTTGDYETPPSWFCEFGELMYKNYIEGVRFIKESLTSDELKQVFNKMNLDTSFDEWIMTYKDKDNVIKIYLDGKLSAFAIINSDKSYTIVNDKILSKEAINKLDACKF